MGLWFPKYHISQPVVVSLEKVLWPQNVRCHESYMGALAGVNRCSTAGEGQPAWERAHLGGRGAGRWKGFRNQVLQASLETLNQAAPAA